MEPKFSLEQRVTVKTGEHAGKSGVVMGAERYYQEVMDNGEFRAKGLRVLEGHIKQSRSYLKDDTDFDGETYKVNYNGSLGTMVYRFKGHAYYVKLDNGTHEDFYEYQLKAER